MSKKAKMTKAEKKEAKAAKKANKQPVAPETKKTWLQSVTALVCVVVLCVTSYISVGKMAEATEKIGATAPAGNSNVVVNNNTAQDDSVVTDDTATDDTTADADNADAADDTADQADDTTADTTDSSADAGTPSDNGSSTDKKDSKPSSNDPTSYGKAQVVSFYNKAIKDSVNAPKVTIKRAETVAIVCDKMNPDSKALKGIVDKILNNYAKTTTETYTFTKGSSTSKDYTKPASKFVCPSNLEASGAKSAKITKSGSDYIVNIAVVGEKSTLATEPKYNKQCSAPLDLGSVDLFGVKVTQADFDYAGTTLKAVVGSNGLLKSLEIFQPLSGTGGGKAIGISVSATLHGSFKQVTNYTYA